MSSVRIREPAPLEGKNMAHKKLKHDDAGLLFAWLSTWALLLSVMACPAEAAVQPTSPSVLTVLPAPYEGLRRTMVCETNSGPTEWRTDGKNLYMEGSILEPSGVIDVWQITVNKNPVALVFFVSFIDLTGETNEVKVAIDFEHGLVEVLDEYNRVMDTFVCK